MYIPLPFHETTTSDAVSTGALPDLQVIVDLLTEVHDHFRPLEEGAVADYIPVLANVDPSLFAVSIVGVAGGSYSVGDAQALFSLQSISKAFVFALVCDTIGHDEAHRKLGVNATGLAFNSVMAIELNRERTMNPMVNAGAMATTSLVPGATAEDRWEFIRHGLSLFAGRPLDLDPEVYASESATNLRNQGIAHLLQSYGRLYADPDETTDLYTAPVLAPRHRVRPGRHGRHAGQRRREPTDRSARHRAVPLQACPGGDGHGRPLRAFG